MTFVYRASLDFRLIGLSEKKKNAIKQLKKRQGYNSYILKMNGDLLKFEISNNKQGYTVKTLKKGTFIILN